MKKASDLTKEEINTEIEKWEEKLILDMEDRNKIQKKINWKWQRIHSLHEALDKIICDSMEKDSNIEYLLKQHPDTKEKRVKIKEIVKSFGFSCDSYFPDSDQRCITIRLYRDDDDRTKRAYKGILFFLPYLIPIQMEGSGAPKEKVIFIKIFEESCSENGIHSLLINPENHEEACVHIVRYHRHTDIKWIPLLKVLEDIQKKYYYDKGVYEYEY